jgi:peptidoglycan/LPS O-acetylase OafA/YrhL
VGLLRVLLAFGVVAEHAGHRFGAGSYTAVEAFFVISGFYMSLIYGRTYDTVRDFYASRFFRLYPMYWVALLGAVVYFAIAGAWGADQSPLAFVESASIGTLGAIYLLLSNAFMLGTDLTWFFPHAFSDSVHSVHFLAITPIWTLSLELVFYALCPLLMRLSDRHLLTIVVASLGARTVGYVCGLDGNPWHARFIGFEIVYFLLGILAHRAYMRGGWRRVPSRSGRALALAVAVVVAAVAFNRIVAGAPLPAVYGLQDYLHSLGFYALVVLALPGLYAWTRTSAADRWIGEHSYPIYVWHYIFVVIFVHSALFASAGLVVALTTVHAVASVHLVQAPVDRIRHRRYRNVAAGAADAASDPLVRPTS